MAPARSYDFNDLGLLSGPPLPAFVACSRLAAELVGVDFGKVTLLDASTNRLLIRASFGFDPKALGIDWEFADLPLSRWIMKRRSIGDIEEANEVTPAEQGPVMQVLGGRSYLAAPIFDPAETPVGTLCVMGRSPRIWSARQKEQMRDLARLTSQAITLKAALATIRLLSPPVARA